jgi:hypothetical protein
MTFDEYEKLPQEEKEHYAEFSECGQFVDKRELRSAVFRRTSWNGSTSLRSRRGVALEMTVTEY